MPSPLPEIVSSLMKEHGPAAILKQVAAECRQNATFEHDQGEVVAAQAWNLAASKIESVIRYVQDVAP